MKSEALIGPRTAVTMNPPPFRGLYAITPEDPLLPRLSAQLEAALRGGVRWVQYRNKSAPPPLRRAQAAEMMRLCRAYGARMIVNDDLPLALEIQADGVHLGREDHGDKLAAAREALGPDKILGVSCYASLALAEAAARAGANYLAFGSLYPSRTKPAAPSAPLTLLGEARQIGLPIAAIGGITLENARPTLEAGADLLAVISDLFESTDIESRARAYTTLFSENASSSSPS